MASPVDNSFLLQATIYLGATAIAVPIFKKLKLGTILGFLAAGILMGPSGLNWLRQEDEVFHVAELGVVLFLFVIGLELSFRRLWSLRRTIFGLGLLQMAVTGLAIAVGFEYFGLMSRGPALVAGFALACSSTAFALSLLEERRELNTAYGTKAFSVLLFQDLAVIPLLAAVPLVARMSAGAEEAVQFEWEAIAAAAGCIIAIVVLGRFVLNWFFRLVAVSGSREAFTAAALFVVAGTSILMVEVGLSMALGAFLAGVLLAESAFRHQIEADIEPFRELLLGLFFIGVGMQLDLDVVWQYWWIVLAGAGGLILLKMAIIYGLARLFRSNHSNALKAAAFLCQGGEFGFVVFSLGVGRGIFETEVATVMSGIITLSMMVTPVIVILAQRMVGREKAGAVPGIEDIDQDGSVLIVGFGRIGQMVNQILHSSNVAVTAIDNNPRRIEIAAQFGNRVYFGDGSDVNLLVQAGATKVDAVVFCISARDKLKPTIQALRERCPKVRILTRVHDRIHEMELMDVEVDYVVREMLESSIVLAQKTLSYLGFSDHMISEITAEYRERDRDRLLAQRAEGIHAKKEIITKPFKAVDRKSDEAEA
ncbi:monovalent cation:proton antiporter-2 (CPA2) family protein [Parvularcula sp. LCG005]|uniref:monovalent cation:proton antiporter-2 (CPA2) family protein n=1 Tax=Parvularcula sp. LCG005 TaxID=3078805 RepID=UPI002942913E|nr:monovalent cation:proton antiporter-2 (CPA2) family protein [Parvularcula sp. LCG005]WOI52018.1 monovalent cation:proton antiporter-2 (CPA2) family protein [Parvularcula sp. LCG005]